MAGFASVATDPGVTADPRNNAWLGLTAAGGTAFAAVLPGLAGYYIRAGGIRYSPGATAHVLTYMIAQNVDVELYATSQALDAQAVVAFNTIPTLLDGSLLAAGDYVTIRHEDGSQLPYVVSSIAAKLVTFTANLAGKVDKLASIWVHGVAGDSCHTRRQLTTVASVVMSIGGGEERLCLMCSPKLGHPVLFFSPNGTNAGIADWVPWYYMPG